MSLIDATRAKWREADFEWGTTDCILSVCDYVLEATGKDPAEPWRGSYQCELGAEAVHSQFGGVMGVFNEAMSRIGFEQSNRGIGRPVVVDFQGHEIVGIDLGRRVMLRMERGVVDWPCDVIGAWKI